MAKFSEVPKFIFNDLLENLNSSSTLETSASTILSKPGHIFTAEKFGYFYGIVEIIDSDNNTAFVEIPFSPATEYYDGENTYFLERRTDLESLTAGLEIPQGSNLYILRRKGGVVQEYLTSIAENGLILGVNTISMSYFVNINKPKLYIGKLYERGVDSFSLDFWGFDRYATTCLPDHNQTTKLKEFFKVSLDQVHNAIYNQARNVQTLLDPQEVNLDYILYLSQMYNIELDKNYYESLFIDRFSDTTREKERRFRGIIGNIVNLLKRKGTYSSLYAVYKSLFNTTDDNLTVYERLHENAVYDFPTATVSGAPFDLEPYFIDLNYLTYYGVTATGCTSGNYYDSFIAQGNPVPITDCYIFQQIISSDTWYIHHNLESSVPIVKFFDNNLNQLLPTSLNAIDSNFIVVTFSAAVTGLALCTKPSVEYKFTIGPDGSEFVHNLDTLAPLTYDYQTAEYTFETKTVPSSASVAIDFVSPLGVNSLYVSNPTIIQNGIVVAVKGDYIHEQNYAARLWEIEHNLNSKAIMADFYTSALSSSWAVTHSLDTQDIVIQPFDKAREVLEFTNITLSTDNLINVTFTEAVSGYVLIKTADEVIDLSTNTSWSETHSLGIYCPVIQAFDGNYSFILTDHIDIIPSADDTTLSISTDYSTDGHLHLVTPDYTHTQYRGATPWYIKHNLGTTKLIATVYVTEAVTSKEYYHNLGTSSLLVQFYDIDGYLVAPSGLSITATTITASFSSPFKGRINITTAVTASLGDFSFYVPMSGTTWYIEHYLDTYAILCKYYNNSMVEIVPSSAQVVNNNWVTATFSTSQTGYACIKLADMCYMAVKTIEAPVEFRDLNTAYTYLDSEDAGYLSLVSADNMSSYLKRVNADNTRPLDSNSIMASFSETETGIAVLKDVGHLTYINGLATTPHYKAEIDMTCEPLNSPDILNKDYANILNDQWELCRPACKYAHYHLLFAPHTNFLGKEYGTYLYNDTTVGNVFTYCAVDASTDPVSGAFAFSPITEVAIWEIEHNLNTENIIVQCYDADRELILPLSVQIIDANNIVIKFEFPTSGICYIISAEDSLIQTPASSDWDWNYTTTPATSAIIADHYFYSDKEQILPSNVQILAVDEIESIWYVPTLGYAQIKRGDYLYVQGTPAFTWEIDHTLAHRGVVVKIYDEEMNEILPEKITLWKGENKITIDFPTDIYQSGVSGVAVITMAGGLYTTASLINSITAGGYLKIGNGTAPIDYNPAITNEMQAPLNTLHNYLPEVSEDSNRYYVKAKAIGYRYDTAVTEFGLFTKYNELVFYSYVINGQLYKKANFDFTIYYMIDKVS